MRAAATLALAVLAGCGGETRNAAAPEGGRSTTIQSEDAVDGRRPELTLSCENGRGSFWLALVHVPPEPLRSATAMVKVDDSAPIRIGLVWLGGDRWAPELDATAESALTWTMLAGRNVYVLGPLGTTERAYRWDLARLGEGIEALRERCEKTSRSS